MFWDQVFHIITRQLISRVYPISATKGRTGQFCGSNPMNQPSHNRNLSGVFVLLLNIVGGRVLFELLLYRLVYLCVCTLSNQNRTFILIFHPICVLLCPRLLMGIVLRSLSKYMHVFTPLIQSWDDLYDFSAQWCSGTAYPSETIELISVFQKVVFWQPSSAYHFSVNHITLCGSSIYD